MYICIYLYMYIYYTDIFIISYLENLISLYSSYLFHNFVHKTYGIDFAKT